MSSTAPPLSRSSVERKRRISLVWAVPIVAVLIGAFLMYDTYSKRGPLITVTWSAAQGLVAGQSHVKHKDVDLGIVQDIALAPDFSHVTVTIRMNRNAVPLLTSNAQFWVVMPRFFAGSFSGLGTVLSGSYIEVEPSAAGGRPQTSFVGLENPPLLQASVAGTAFLLRASRIGSISVGSPIFYRDLTVGDVLGWDLDDMAESVTIHAFIRAPFDRYVRPESHFWNASGISLKMGAGGVSLQVESLKALLLGGVAFETPQAALQTASAEPVKEEFRLFADQDAANRAGYHRRVMALSYFPGSVGGLEEGSAVTFHGLRIGQVLSVGLAYDSATDTIRAPVRYEIEPERIAFVQAAAARGPVENARILVKRGLRAQIQSANLLTGEMEVGLDMLPDSPPAELTVEGQTIILPAVPGGLSGLTNSASELLSKINRMPFDQIGRNLNETLAGAAHITNGPEIANTLRSLQTALSTTQELMRTIDTNATPALKKLPEIAASLQGAVTQANKTLGSINTGYGDDSPFQRQLTRLLMQFNDTARSMRALADLLSRHPEALIQGRASGGAE